MQLSLTENVILNFTKIEICSETQLRISAEYETYLKHTMKDKNDLDASASTQCNANIVSSIFNLYGEDYRAHSIRPLYSYIYENHCKSNLQ